VFYDLACDIAHTIHKFRPDCNVYFTNGEMDIEENERLFSLIRDDPDCPLAGYSYSEGGSENSTYGYKVVNTNWPILYPEVDPKSSFLHSRLDYLHPEQKIVLNADVTHWKRAGSAVWRPDPVWSETFPRRVYNARPIAYTNLFAQQTPYAIGFFGYSEGLFDDFNKYMLMRMLWDSALTADELALEYYTYYCGPDAAPYLAEAVFIGERIMEAAYADSAEHIKKYLGLILAAEARMSSDYRVGNWRFAMMKQRALIFEDVRKRQEQLATIYADAMQTLESGRLSDPAAAINSALATLDDDEPEVTLPTGLLFVLTGFGENAAYRDIKPDRLMEMILALDDETEESIAIREYAITKIAAGMDHVGVNWLAQEITALKNANLSDAELNAGLQEILLYDVVGENEFYDNCSSLSNQPNFKLETGEAYYGSGGLSQDYRPSQRAYNYSFEHAPGLEFSYRGCDTNALYETTIAVPNPGKLSFSSGSDNAFEVFANDKKLGWMQPIPGLEFYTFPLPFSETKESLFDLVFRKLPDGRCIPISEVWVRKRRSAFEAMWDFTDETLDDFDGRLNGVANGSVSIVDAGTNSPLTRAVQFGETSSTDYLQCGDLESLGIYTNSFTVSLWVRHSFLTTNDTLSCKLWNNRVGNSTDGYQGIQMSIFRGNGGTTAGRLYANVGVFDPPGGELLKSDVRIDDDEWHWIVLRHNASAPSLELFVDGRAIPGESASKLGVFNRLEPGKMFRLGEGFGGELGDIRIYSKALSFDVTDGVITGGELFDVGTRKSGRK
jgi:hypothetical protein